MIALDVVVAWALYRVFRPVSKRLSMLAAALRLVYSGVFMVAIAQLLGVVRLLSNDATLAVFSTDQVNAQAMLGITAFTDIWYVGQFLFGLHLLLIGYLAYRSGYVPRVLGVLLVIAGLGYATDSLGAVLSSGHLDRHQLLHLPRRVPAGPLARDPIPPHRGDHILPRQRAGHRRRLISKPGRKPQTGEPPGKAGGFSCLGRVAQCLCGSRAGLGAGGARPVSCENT